MRQIPQRVLLAGGAFGTGLPTSTGLPESTSLPESTGLPESTVLAAIARGLRAGGSPDPDVCALSEPVFGEDARTLLDALSFDLRMRSARAVVVCAERLEEQALAGSVTFEIATRARQGGVPAFAVTGENRLDPFDARILDLQVILEAGSTRALTAAGRKLARLIGP